MRDATKSAAVFLLFAAVSPALMAPSCYGKNGGSFGPSDITSIPAPRPDPPTGLGPAFGPIAVGGAVTLDDTAELVQPCSAFSLDRLLGGPRLHALAAGTCTVRFQTSQGEKTLDYVALVADALQVTPGWCPGDYDGGPTCGVHPGDTLTIYYSLWNGGVHATQLEAGDLCPFTIPAFTSDVCIAGHLELDLTGPGAGTIGSPLDPTLALAIESTSP